MRQLKDVQVDGMALVRRPANKKRFLTKKSEEASVANEFAAQVQAPSEAVSDAIDAIRLTKGESVEGHEALHTAAHMLAGRDDLSAEDFVHFAKALGYEDLVKAAPKKGKDEDEDEEEDEEDEDSDESQDDAAKDGGKAEDGDDMPEFLKRKLKKADWDEAQHPRDEHGRFGTSAGGSSVDAKEARNSSEKAFKSGSADDHADAADAHAKAANSSNGDLHQAAHHTAAAEHRMLAAEREGGKKAPKDSIAADKAQAAEKLSQKAAASMSRADHHAAATAHNAARDASNKAQKKGDSFSHAAYHSAAAEMHTHLSLSPRLKKSRNAEDSANQGGPMGAEAKEIREFVSKSDHEALIERLTKSELELADIRSKEALRIEKSANEEAYGHLEIDHDALADVTMELRKSDEKKLDALATILKAANEQVRVAKASGGSPFRPQALRGGMAKSQEQGIGKFQDMVAAYAKENPGHSKAQAVTAVAKSAEGLAAYRASKGEI